MTMRTSPLPYVSFMPNDFGLYNMAGNVNEWVLDLYRPLTSSTLSDVRIIMTLTLSVVVKFQTARAEMKMAIW
jgi:formylglycine-generating enzyme required for sulfatase activity